MDNTLSNLLSGALGALFVLALGLVASRISTAIRLNGIRRRLLAYLDKIVVPSLQNLEVEYSSLDDLSFEKLFELVSFRTYPMLRVDFLKSHNQEDIHNVIRDLEMEIIFYAIQYNIEHLRNHLPIELRKSYVSEVDELISSQGHILTHKEQMTFYNSNPRIDMLRKVCRATAAELKQTTVSLIRLSSELKPHLTNQKEQWVKNFLLPF